MNRVEILFCLVVVLIFGSMVAVMFVSEQNRAASEQAEKARIAAELAKRQIPVSPMKEVAEVASQTKRFSAEFQGEFNGGFGNHVRQVFILTDSVTGVEYLVITGCGVTELWTETYTEKVGIGKNRRSITKTRTCED